jgi:chromosome segregation ATPase
VAERKTAEQRTEQLATELAALKEQLLARDRELAGATTTLAELAGKVEAAERRAKQERQAATNARAETTTARAQADRLREQLREEAGRAADAALEAAVAAARLEAAQAAAGLVLPELTDLSSDLVQHDGVLPDTAIEVVAQHPDGSVVLYWHNARIPLGDPERAPAHGQALAAAILAASFERP